MPKFPDLPPPTVADVISVGTPMQIWCDFCRIQYAVRRSALKVWAAKHPPRLQRLAMEVPRMMRCRRCGHQTLNGLLCGNPHYRSSVLGPPIDQGNE